MALEPLRVYDYLTTARQRVLENVRPLTAEQYGREYPIGLGTLGAILTHVMISEWYYVQRIGGHDVPPYEQWPIKQEDPPPFATIESTWTKQAGETRAALSAVSDWTADIEYRVTTDEGLRQIVTASAADLFTQLALHEVHHRGQAMNLLRHLGAPVGDLDFNSFFDRREGSG